MIEFEKNIGLKPGDTFAHLEVRREMIKSQITTRGVKNPAVLKGLEKVPRHRFVNESLENSAYDDAPLPIGEGQSISQPFIVGRTAVAVCRLEQLWVAGFGHQRPCSRREGPGHHHGGRK